MLDRDRLGEPVDAPTRRGPRVDLVSFDFADFVVPLANALASHTSVLLQTPVTQLEASGSAVSDAVEVHAFSAPRLRQPLRQRATVQAIGRASSRFGAEVTHLQQGHLWFNLGLLGGRRRPLVVTVHDPSPHRGDVPSRRTPPSVMRIPFTRADHLIVHSGAVRDRLVDEIGIGEERISVVELLAPTLTAPPKPLVDVPDRPRTVLFFGRIWPYKGLDVLLRAEPLVAAAIPDLRIVVAGEGEPWSHYDHLVTDPSRYELRLGHVCPRERDELFGRADVVVLPYVDATQSGVVPLAHRHGRAVVASDVAGLADQVIDGVTGLLVPPGDVRALASALVCVLANPARRDRLASAGRARQAMRSAPDAVAAKTLHAYEQAVVAAGSEA